MEGLRTLVFAQKELTKAELDQFMKQYNMALNSMQNRDHHINQSLKLLEYDMNFIGVSGVEDKLQDHV